MAKEKKTKQKAKIVRWRGVLADRNRILRWMIALVLMVTSIVFTFTQLGFVGFELPDGTNAYVVVLLQIVALGALLLGTLPGAGIGLIAGTVLYAHARLLPLDYYELAFVTPTTSIVMLTVSGFLLGVLFAFALRNNPSRLKSIIYIAIVCTVVSWLYSMGFVVNVIISLIMNIVEQRGIDANAGTVDSDISAAAAQLAVQLGDVDTQAWTATALMTLLCGAGDYLAYKVKTRERALGIRTVFGMWLLVVVALSFMATSAASFAVTTEDERRSAESDMASEANYLCKQLEQSHIRAQSLITFTQKAGIDLTKLSKDEISAYFGAIDDMNLLNGYTAEEDGTIIITLGKLIYTSDDKTIADALNLESSVCQQMIDAMNASLESGRSERYINNGIPATLPDGTEASHINKDPYIAFVFAKRIEFENAEGTPIDHTVIISRPSQQVFAERARVMGWTTASSLILLLAVFFITFQLLNRVVARPIDKTNAVLARITDGDLDARVNIHDSSEFESLSTGIDGTVETLKGWIAEAETRMDAELATAKAIQESALPRIFPPFPDILRFDVYATMKAAKEVGGDFYDFFLIGDDCTPDAGKLGFIIADVSGKGVPAALFMMKAKTQIRDYMLSGMELGEAIENANRQLCDGNDAGMFVTVWAGILDYDNWHVDYVNAGHNPPLLWREGGWVWLNEKSGLPLGLFDGLPYKTHSVECRVGDEFLLYTDGVTEAMDVENNLYGEGRLEEVAVMNYPKHPRDLVDAISKDVALHSKGAEQSDDITMLALEVGVPPEITSILKVPAELTQLDRVNEFIHSELDRRLCPLRAQNQLDIAVEELFVNVCRYAYPDATPEEPGYVHIGYTYSADPPSITVDIIDSGIPFDPLAKPDAVTPDDIAKMPIGGLGILMAKKSVDAMTYERVDDTNVVTIVKEW